MAKITLVEVKERASGLAQAGLVKSSQTMEIAKLQIGIVSQEDVIKKSFFELGKRYYEQHGDNPEPAYEAACQKASASYKNIAEKKEKIKELKHRDVLDIYDIPTDAVEADIEIVDFEKDVEEI